MVVVGLTDVDGLPGRVVVGNRGTISPVRVSTVESGGSGTTMSSPDTGSTMRARTGSGRIIRPLASSSTAVAGWLGGRSTGRPSSSVGTVTPPGGRLANPPSSPERLSHRSATASTTSATATAASRATEGGGSSTGGGTVSSV